VFVIDELRKHDDDDDDDDDDNNHVLSYVFIYIFIRPFSLRRPFPGILSKHVNQFRELF